MRTFAVMVFEGCPFFPRKIYGRPFFRKNYEKGMRLIFLISGLLALLSQQPWQCCLYLHCDIRNCCILAHLSLPALAGHDLQFLCADFVGDLCLMIVARQGWSSAPLAAAVDNLAWLFVLCFFLPTATGKLQATSFRVVKRFFLSIARLGHVLIRSVW